MFNKLQQCVPILYAISLILQRIISQIILPLFKTGRREWIIHFKPAAISLRDLHPEELKAIAILSQERVSFGRTTLGIKSLKMILMSFPNNSPTRPVHPALASKITLMAAVASVGCGQQQRMLLQHPTVPWDRLGQCSNAQVAKWSRKFLAKFFATLLMFSCGTMCGETHCSPLKEGQIIFMKHRNCFLVWKWCCLMNPGITIYLPFSLCCIN